MSLSSADQIARSNRTDLYLGVVAPVGVRRDSFLASLHRALSPFGYELEMIRLSALIEDFEGTQIDRTSEARRLETAMDAGSRLRRDVGADVLARAAMTEVAGIRSASDPATRRAFVLWSLKHPEEVATLRLVYAAGFHLLGLFASEAERVAELQNRPGIDESSALSHVARDSEEVGRQDGQRVRDTFHRSDIFLHWGRDPDERALVRFIDLLFGSPQLTPTADEHHMFLAFAGGLRSGELSRQVGAALVSAEGDLLAVGANDVPRRGGGLYWPGNDDDRDAARGEDWNARTRRRLLEEVAEDLEAEDMEAVVARLEASKLKEITEYGRAVHAEMEAMLACARSGRSTRGATLYVTTYPCHNCARHIIAAGIARVVYVEPYPKSRALEFHEKDLAEVGPGGVCSTGHVTFEPYLGVGPRRFFDYFSMTLGDGYELRRKDEVGRLISRDPSTAAPRVQMTDVPFAELEKNLGMDLLPFRRSSS